MTRLLTLMAPPLLWPSPRTLGEAASQRIHVIAKVAEIHRRPSQS